MRWWDEMVGWDSWMGWWDEMVRGMGGITVGMGGTTMAAVGVAPLVANALAIYTRWVALWV